MGTKLRNYKIEHCIFKKVQNYINLEQYWENTRKGETTKHIQAPRELTGG